MDLCGHFCFSCCRLWLVKLLSGLAVLACGPFLLLLISWELHALSALFMYLLKRLLTCIDIFWSSYTVISSSLCFLRPLVQDLEHTRQNQSHGVLCCVLVHSEEGVTLSTSCGGVSYLVFFGTGNRNQFWCFLEETQVSCRIQGQGCMWAQVPSSCRSWVYLSASFFSLLTLVSCISYSTWRNMAASCFWILPVTVLDG